MTKAMASIVLGLVMCSWAQGQTVHKFYFVSPGAVSIPANAAAVTPNDAFVLSKGFGYELLPATDKPALFSIKLEEGTYLVKVTLGGPADAITTIKSECRQLQIENVATKPGEEKEVTFAVNIRLPKISGSEKSVGLKKAPARNYDESENPRWDDKLTLEFNSPAGSTYAVQSLEISSAPALPVVYLIGDSTVCDQPGEPYNSWGQTITRWLGPGVAVANHAESGESFASFLGERRWDKIASTIKKRDFVLLQMGHNDQKIKEEDYANKGYSTNAKKIIAAAKAAGAIPVIVTPPERQRFKEGKAQDSLGDFPQALRNVGKELGVPVIDLTAETKVLYEALGPTGSTPAFAPKDATHHSNYGSYEISKIIANGIKSQVPELAKHLRNDLPEFDPAKPDPLDKFSIPQSPAMANAKPAGS